MAKQRGRKAKVELNRAARTIWFDNPSISDAELGRRCGVAGLTIQRWREAWIAPGAAASAEEDAEKKEKAKERMMLRRLAARDTELATPEGRLAELYKIVRQAPPSVKVRAIEVLDDFSRQMGTGTGPRKPMDDDEMVTRLRGLLQAAGQELAFRAYLLAWGQPPQPAAEPEKPKQTLVQRMRDTIAGVRAAEGAATAEPDLALTVVDPLP